MNKCPYCRQPMKGAIAFPYLPLRQLRIYTATAAAGKDGIDKKELLAIMYGQGVKIPPGGPVVMRVQIHGLNLKLAGLHQRIIGRRKAGYYLVATP